MKLQIANQPANTKLSTHAFDFVPWVDITMSDFKVSIVQSKNGELFITQRSGEGFNDIHRQMRLSLNDIKLYGDTATPQNPNI